MATSSTSQRLEIVLPIDLKVRLDGYSRKLAISKGDLVALAIKEFLPELAKMIATEIADIQALGTAPLSEEAYDLAYQRVGDLVRPLVDPE